MQCPYSFHISSEYCWILMSGSYVLSSDCIAAVESCITLCGIEERKDQSQLNHSQKLCICQKCIKSFGLFGHKLALLPTFVFNLSFFFSDWISKFGDLRVGVFLVLLLVDSFLLVVDCALFDVLVCCNILYIYLNYLFSINLQEKIVTVTVEGVENVGEEDYIKI